MKVKTILVSQPDPKNETSPYFELTDKRKEYDVETEYGQNIQNQLKYTDIFKNMQF